MICFQCLIKRLMLISLVLSSGCTRAPERSFPVFPVGGQLFINGNPGAGATVTFHPIVSDEATAPAMAVVHENGQFSPSQPDGANGLPEGSYALTIEWIVDDIDRLRGVYNDPEKPVAKVEVRAGVNMIPSINLRDIQLD